MKWRHCYLARRRGRDCANSRSSTRTSAKCCAGPPANISVPTQTLIAAHFVAGFLADLQLDLPQARDSLAASLALAQQQNDRLGMAKAMIRLGVIAVDNGVPAEGMRLLSESIALCREVGDAHEEATALQMLGDALYHQGQLD